MSHELIHVRHADPKDALFQHSAWRHLWMTEEGEAHLRELHTARTLNVPLLYSATSNYAVFIYPIPLTTAFFATIALLWFFAQRPLKPVVPFLGSPYIKIAAALIACAIIGVMSTPLFAGQQGWELRLIYNP